MDDLDAMLRDSNPVPKVSEYADELATSIARSKVRRPRRRAGIAIAAVLGGGLALGGGVAAVAQAGWFGPERYVDGPDMTGVRSVIAGGVRYNCEYTLHVDADYSGPDSYQRITDGVQEAHRYIRTLDPSAIKPDQKFAAFYVDPSAPDSPQEEFDVWSHTVLAKVDQHLADLRFPSVGMETQLQCEPSK